MEHTRYIGRIGGLAVALGIGAGVIAMPWAAYAKPADSGSRRHSSSAASDGPRSYGRNAGVSRTVATVTGTESPAARGAAPPAANSISRPATRPNVVSVSINGRSLIGTAASSDKGSVAIAIGPNSTATATGGTQNFALVIGRNSTASAA